MKNSDCRLKKVVIYYRYGKPRSQAACPLFYGGTTPPDERKEGLSMVTYSDLFQFCLFIVALISLLYQIFKDKK